MGLLLRAVRAWLAAAFVAASLMPVAAGAAEPIKIGFGMALTGGLAGNGKAALVAMKIWAEEVNAKGGLLGRPVQLIYYDDQTNPALVPGIYTKLLDVDKVDLVVSGNGTNLQAPAMPVIMPRGMTFMGLFGLAVNDQFHYDRFFQIQPNGQNAKISSIEGFFQAAMTVKPTPATVAIVGADAEYPEVATEGAREIAQKLGLKIRHHLQDRGRRVASPKGEWAKARVIFVQYHGIAGSELEQFKKPGTEVIVAPDEFRTGDVEAPYSDIKH